tara:strand:+ start:3840 stop:4049 length:210 start_codon:yes stop_codon:yes gene_type:complete
MTKLEKLKAVLDTTNAAFHSTHNAAVENNALPAWDTDTDPVNAAYDAWDSAREAYRVELKKQQEKTNGV